MYTEKVKFQFDEEISDSDRLARLMHLFKELEAQSAKFEQLVNGGIYKYQIEHDGKVSLTSCFPGSTSIVEKFLVLSRREGIVK